MKITPNQTNHVPDYKNLETNKASKKSVDLLEGDHFCNEQRLNKVLIREATKNLPATLLDAARKGDLNTIRVMINELKKQNLPTGAVLNAAFVEGAKHNQRTVLEALMQEGIDASAFKEARTVASQNGATDTLEFVLGFNIKYDYTQDSLNKDLDLAVNNGRSEMVENLISQNPETAKWDFDRLLHLAARHGQLNVMEVFIKAGTKSLEWALEGAAEGGSFEAVDYLINKGAKNFDEAIKGASRTGKLQMVKRLVELGASNLEDALRSAAAHNQLDIVKFLIEKGGKNFDSALDIAASSGHMDTVSYLADNGATDLDRALVSATISGHSKVCEFLIGKGATDLDGALRYAVLNGRLDIVKSLKNLGANLNEYHFFQAATGGYVDLMEYIREQGVKNIDFDWALKETAKRGGYDGYLESIKYLVKNGAKALNEALLIAVVYDHFSVAKYLSDNGATNLKEVLGKAHPRTQLLWRNYLDSLKGD